MKVLILNTSETIGGAAVAARRLKNALLKAGEYVLMLVRDKQTTDRNVIEVNTNSVDRKINWLCFVWERLVIFFSNGLNRENLFKVSIANCGVNNSFLSVVNDMDIIHLHWINQGFLSLKQIKEIAKSGKPVVWTMHDMWPCTAICHYSWDCERFHNECGMCPFLRSSNEEDLSQRVWKKKRFFSSSGIQFVAVSSWLAKQAQESSLMKGLDIKVIPNVIDTTVFFQKDQLEIRKLLGLPLDKKIILMGAARLDDPIKGFQYLKEALKILSPNRTDILLILFGSIKNSESFFQELSVPYISLGLLTDNNQISDLYSAANVTVVPSLYETFGQTLIEAMACGCPTVSFNNSGQTDIIDHQVNGFLAEYKNSTDLAAGISWVLDRKDQKSLEDACIRNVHEHYTEQVVAKQYIKLYNELLQKGAIN